MIDVNREGGSTENSENSEPTAASSPSDLLEHLIRMTDSLEKAWSKGMGDKAVAEARREAKDLWVAFANGLMHRLEWVQGLDERLGLSTLAEAFPLDDAGLSRLTLDPSKPEERYRQLQFASLYALDDLAKALDGLDNPTGTRIDLLSGQVTERWWEAGGFALLRRRAAALARILRAQERCLKELANEREDVPAVPNESLAARASWSDALRMASDLTSLGYSEAALAPLLQALRLVLAEAAAVGAEELPVPLAPPLRGIPLLASLAGHVELLEAATERLGKGSSLDAGVAVPLAKELLARIHRLAVNPPPRRVLEPLREGTNG